MLAVGCAADAISGTVAPTPQPTSIMNTIPLASNVTLIPPFTPPAPCALEVNEAVYQWTIPEHTPTQVCSRHERIEETVVVETDSSVLIRRAVFISQGCWHGTTSEVVSLRACNRASGAITTLAEDVLSGFVFSPDGQWLAFVEPAAGSLRLEPHIYRVRRDGSELVRLDTQPFPQNQVVGVSLGGWSPDGSEISVSLWDGLQGGWHSYWLRTDGSGEFEVVP